MLGKGTLTSSPLPLQELLLCVPHPLVIKRSLAAENSVCFPKFQYKLILTAFARSLVVLWKKGPQSSPRHHFHCHLLWCPFTCSPQHGFPSHSIPGQLLAHTALTVEVSELEDEGASSSAGGGSGLTAPLPTMPAHVLSWLSGCPRVMPGQCCWCRGAPGLPQDHSHPACTAPTLLSHGDRLCRLPSSCRASWPAPPWSLQRFS